MHLVIIHNLKYGCSAKKEENMLEYYLLYLFRLMKLESYFCIMMVMQFDKISDQQIIFQFVMWTKVFT